MTSLTATADAPRTKADSRRLWIEFATPSIAWHILNFVNMIILWLACVHREQLGVATAHPVARAIFFLSWVVIFGASVAAGVMSYRSWRKLSKGGTLLNAEASEREEYMSFCGLLTTVVLGAGFIWLSLPLFIIEMCLRIR